MLQVPLSKTLSRDASVTHGAVLCATRLREMRHQWMWDAMAGDSVRVMLLDFLFWRGCLRLTFTYIETDDIKRVSLWEHLFS